jgi:hypothetical protein
MVIEEFILQFRDVLPPADIPIPEMSASQCLDVIVDAEKMTSFYDAQTARALARFAELRPPTRPGMDLADGAREEVSMERAIAPQTAATQVRRARELVTRLPQTLAALAEGRIDQRRALAMSDLTAELSEEDAKLVEGRVLVQGRRSTPGRFKEVVRRHVTKVDAEAEARRRRANRERRDVGYQPCFDGMGQLIADLTTEETATVRQRIEGLVEQLPDDERSPEQREADVLRELLFGGQFKGVDVVLTITVPLLTLQAFDQHLRDPPGTGPAVAELVRELAQDPTWRHMISDPSGRTLDLGHRRYASAALARHIRVRDRTCRVPGCTALAEHSEIDHTIRHVDHGRTNPANTGAYCKFHNLWKERSSWKVAQPTPGTFIFTSPENRVYTNRPDPYEEPPCPDLSW